MSFSLDASKAQAGNNPAAPGTGTPGFPTGGIGTGDASKILSPGFSLPSMQNQPKPGGMFGLALSGSSVPAFGSAMPQTTGIQQSTGLNLVASTPGTGLTFGATTTPATGSLNFGAGGLTTSTGFGATSFSGGGLVGAAQTPSIMAALTFGAPKVPMSTGFSIGGAVPTSQTSAVPKPNFGLGATTSSSTAFSLGGGITATPAPLAAPTTTATGFGLLPSTVTAATPQSGLSLGPTTSSTGFSLAPSTAVASSLATGFGINQTSTIVAAATTAPPGFSQSVAITAPATAFNLGSSTAPTISSSFAVNKTTSTQAVATAVTTNVTPQTTLGTVTTVSSANSGQAGTMNFCQLEESINKWTLELEEQEKAFVNQATQVNSWDKLLIANGEKIATLNQEIERVKLEQQQLDHELDYVVGQQKELQDCLVPLEKELASHSVADPERDYTYRLAENLDKQLKQMSQDLKEIIEHLNEANRSRDSSDPIVQIGKILNAHMNSLQWVDQRTSVLTQKIQQIDQMHDSFRQENERSFSLAYN